MSLIGAYNSIKSLIVTKLISKGVSNVNINQGMTTLINKINDIETNIPTTLNGVVNGTYPPNVDVNLSFGLSSSFENDDGVGIDAPITNADIGIYIDNTLEETITTDNNGVASYILNIDTKGTYSFIVVFDESRPFDSAILTGLITIFISIIKYFKNITFTHNNGGSSMSVSYNNNESITMSVQSFEEDNTTVSLGSQVDYLIGTSIGGSEDIALEPNVEYDLTGYDFDIIEMDILDIGQYSILFDNRNDYYLSNSNYVDIRQLKVVDNTLYIINGYGEYEIGVLDNLKVTTYNEYGVLRKYEKDNFVVEDTVLNNNQGYSSYTYNAQGIGDVYIKAQSHDDPTIHTDNYLISDWIKKDFINIGEWVPFTGRVNTFSSNTDTVFTQGNGSKGGVHSQNTIFYLPNDDYIVSFKVNNGTIGTGVRVGLHSASYNDHHEKAVLGIENDSSGGFKFDYSDSNSTTVTKITTGVTKLATGALIEFEVIDDTVTCYIDGVSYTSVTLDWLHTPIWLYGQSWSTNNGNFSITDFRVKRII